MKLVTVLALAFFTILNLLAYFYMGHGWWNMFSAGFCCMGCIVRLLD